MSDLLSLQEFGAQIKAKYPAYASKSDEEVGRAMLAKYPQYNSRVQTGVDTSNPQGQGTYAMKDGAGNTAQVPYGQVPHAAQAGYQFADDQTKFRFNKDYNYATTGPSNQAAFEQSDKNAPLPMQAVSGVAKGIGEMGSPVMAAVGKLGGVPQKTIDQSLQAQTPAEKAAKVGTIAATVLPDAAAIAGPTVAKAANAVGSKFIPSLMKEQAAGLLQYVAHDANKLPVQLENAGDAAYQLAKWQDKAALGPTINKFLQRVTSPKYGPLTYEDARDYYQLLSKLSVDETNKLAPPIKYQVTRLVAGLKQDIGDTADMVGKAAEYYKGLQDYAKAKRLEEWLSTAGNYAVKAGLTAAGAGGLATAWKYLGPDAGK